MRFIPQLDPADCGAACLAMVADHFRCSHSLAKIRHLAGTDQNGTNLAGLVRAGEALGFETRALKGNAAALTRVDLPLIAHLNLRLGESVVPHFVVVQRIRHNRVTIYDPQHGIVQQPVSDFLNLWTGYVVAVHPRQDFRPDKTKKGLFARFFPAIKPFANLLVLVAVGSLVLVILGIVGSFYFRYLIDDVLPSRSELTLHSISLGVLVLTFFQALLEAVRKKLLLYFSLRVDNGIVFAYFHHVLTLPMSFFDARMSGDLLSRLSQVSQIRGALSDAALTLVMDTLMVVVVGTVLFFQSSTLFLVSVVSVPLVTGMIWVFSKLFSANYQALMADGADVQSHLVETFQGMATVKALNAEQRIRELFDEKQSKVIWATFRLGTLEIHQGLFLALINGWAGNLLFWVGSYLILHDTMSLGQLISFNVLLGFFLGPLQRLVNLQSNLQQAFVAADRVGEIFDLKAEGEGRRSQQKPATLDGPLEFSRVCFRYGTRRPIIEGLNLTIPRGQQVALVGPSGSGKSTLVKLLLKFYDQESGQITLNGIPLADIDTAHLRAHIGYVPQEVFLFSGTILENLRMGRPEATLEMVITAARRAGALAFIEAQPDRFDTVLTEKGASLSGGERQRLALARALVGNPALIVFDEATSNLDAVSERRVLDTLKTLRDGKTTIVLVAHRLPTIVDSDMIHVFEEGKIAESGNHASLLQSRGPYARLWSEGGL